MFRKCVADFNIHKENSDVRLLIENNLTHFISVSISNKLLNNS